MRHEHLPALNRYTSPKQYEAMREITQNKSITSLLMNGSFSKTVGSLLRSAWVAPNTYADSEGVMREGWVVTDAGRHAMNLYESKLEQEHKLEEARLTAKAKRDAMLQELYDTAVAFYVHTARVKECKDKCVTIINTALIHDREAQPIYQRARDYVLEQLGTQGEAK